MSEDDLGRYLGVRGLDLSVSLKVLRARAIWSLRRRVSVLKVPQPSEYEPEMHMGDVHRSVDLKGVINEIVGRELLHTGRASSRSGSEEDLHSMSVGQLNDILYLHILGQLVSVLRSVVPPPCSVIRSQ